MAHWAANLFAGDRGHEGVTDILAEMMAGQRLLADRMQLDWASIRKLSGEIYIAQVKAAKPAKQAREPIAPAALYGIRIVAPDGEVIFDERPVAYRFAVLQRLEGLAAWGIRSRVNSKAVASSRCHTFRSKGVDKDNLAIVEVFPQPLGDAPVLTTEPVAPSTKPAKPASRRKAAQVETEAEAEGSQVQPEGQNLEYPGSDKVHAPNLPYTGALCGAGKGKDARQTEAEVTCRNCQRLITLYTLTAEGAAEAQAVAE